MKQAAISKQDTAPNRKCLVLQESAPKAGLIRFVKAPGGIIVPDVLGKLPGRGFYVTSEKNVLQKAIDNKMFPRSSRKAAQVPENLIEMIEQQMAQRVIHLISMARKAGQAVCGFEKVKSWLATGQVKVLLQAVDGSQRGKSKLWTPEGARFFDCLTASELGLAFGRTHVIHSAVATGGLGKRVIEDAAKLRGLRNATPPNKDAAGSKKDG